MLRLRLLGSFELRGPGDKPITISARKTRALLAFLALQSGTRQSRERLAALLWEDADAELARSSLRQALAALRRALPAKLHALLETDGQQVALNLAQLQVDVHSLRTLLAEATFSSLRAARALGRGAARGLRCAFRRFRGMGRGRAADPASRDRGGRDAARRALPRGGRHRRRDRRARVAPLDRAACRGRAPRADGLLCARGAVHGGAPPVPAPAHGAAPRARPRAGSRDRGALSRPDEAAPRRREWAALCASRRGTGRCRRGGARGRVGVARPGGRPRAAGGHGARDPPAGPRRAAPHARSGGDARAHAELQRLFDDTVALHGGSRTASRAIA